MLQDHHLGIKDMWDLILVINLFYGEIEVDYLIKPFETMIYVQHRNKGNVRVSSGTAYCKVEQNNPNSSSTFSG